ncbi:MAG: hydroxymethylbilane synthase [candidate division Zixibacteria bacterium]|nr:hydroxymethylbilane synthase [candidate division Zixibacteria bacterium]
MSIIRIGTRCSPLAVVQAKFIAELLVKYHPGQNYELIKVTTSGDTDTDSSLQKIGGTGVFTKRIEQELLKKEIDVAVHSAKDLPSIMTEGLTIGAVPARAAIEDAWLSGDGKKLMEIEADSVVGSGSPRRQFMLLNIRPDLKVRDIRGNIQTRIRKLEDGDYDALIMARAGLERMGLEGKITEILSVRDFLPAPGQGALVVQIRSEDENAAALMKSLDNANVHRCLDSERLLLSKLNAGCSAAVGGLAVIESSELILKAVVLDKTGSNHLHVSGRSPAAADDVKMVASLVSDLLSQGAQAYIEQ